MSPIRQVHPPEFTPGTIDLAHKHAERAYKTDLWRNCLLGGIILLLVLLFLQGHGWAQGPGLGDTGNQIKHVICDSGCSSSSSPAYGATFPATGTPIGVKNGLNMVNLAADGSSNLFVNCAVGCSASAGFADNAAFTAGTTTLNIAAGWYSTSPTNCTSGSACAPQLTLDRKLFVQDFQGTSPWVVSNGGTFAVQAAESGTWNVTVNTSLPAGTAVIGHVIADSGSTTAVTGTVAVTQSGTWSDRIVGSAGGVLDAIGQNVAAPANWLSIGCEFITSPTTITTTNGSPCQMDSSANILTKINVALPTGSNVIGHVIADSGSTTAVTGTVAVTESGTWNVRTQDGAGNGFTTNSTTYTAKFALDGNLLGTLGTAFTTAGKVDVKGADGDVFVRQTTGTNLHVVADSGSTTAVTGTVAVTESGTWTNRVVGNAGAAIDAATGAAPPANAILHAGLGSGATGGFMVGLAVSDTYKPINVSTATTTLLVTGVSGRQVRIGSINLITASANNVALIEGTGATCGTGSAGMNGGTTGASGWNFAANGGIAYGSGLGTIMQTATTGDSVCIVTSAAVQLSGGMQYTIY